MSDLWNSEPGGSGGGTWGTITGTLSDQTDLQTALDAKVDENAAITGATKTKITYDAKGLVTAGADATTADIADSLNKRYVTDAQLTVLGNTSGTNTGDVTVSDSSEIDFTLTGQQISASIVSGSIDETKLDTSVNASLDLADSASQPGHTHTASAITDFQTTVSANTDVAASKVKTDFITITQAVDLDTIEARVNSLDAAVVLRGSWDASAGTFPGGGTAQAGDSYIVSVGGTVDSQVFTANDRIVAILDNASTSTYASNWLKLDYTDQVLSVFGRTGAVVAQAGDYSKSDVGLGNVENTALSTWAGSSNLTTVGTLTGGATGAGFTIALGTSTLTGDLPFANLAQLTANAIAANVTGSTADIAALTIGANTFPARSSSGDMAAKTITDFGLSLVDDVDAATARTTLGLVAGGSGDIWVEKAGDTMTGNLTISNTTPSLVLTDTTASAKGLTVAVDANVANLRESAGSAGSLLALDLANNRIGIGTAAPTSALTLSANTTTLPAPNANTVLHIGGADGASGGRFLIEGFGAGPSVEFRRSNTSAASPSALASGDVIGQFAWFGYGATGYSSTSRGIVRCTTTQDWTDTNQGAKLTFFTTPNNSTTVAERMTILNSGYVGIGTTAPDAPFVLDVGDGSTLPSFSPGTPSYRIAGANSTSLLTAFNSWTAASNFIGQRAEGTRASPSATAANVPIFAIAGRGYDTTNLYGGGSKIAIDMRSVNAWTSTDNSTRMRFQTTPTGSTTIATDMTVQGSNIGIGTETFGTSAAKVLAIFNGTEPSTSPADTIQLYSVDLSAGNATLGLRTETAVTAAAAGASDAYLNIRINGTTYKLLLHT